MALFLASDDFKGKYKISQNCYSELELFIDQYEWPYICQLFGAELAEEFKNDLDGSNQPQDQRFIDIFNPFCKDQNTYSGWLQSNCILESAGIPEMLKGFIYYQYATASNVKHTITGHTKSINENTDAMSYEAIYRTAEIRYNEALESFNSIQACICENLDDYPNWNGIKLHAKFYGIL